MGLRGKQIKRLHETLRKMVLSGQIVEIRKGRVYTLGKQADLFIRQLTPFTCVERRIKLQWPDGLAVQGDDPIADCSEHALDLMVASFVDGQSHLSGREQFQLRCSSSRGVSRAGSRPAARWRGVDRRPSGWRRCRLTGAAPDMRADAAPFHFPA